MKRIFLSIALPVFFAVACNARTENHSIAANPVDSATVTSELSRQLHDSETPPSWDTDDIADLRRAIADSNEHGLRPEDYHQSALASPNLKWGERALLATDAYLTLASHLQDGKVDAQRLAARWENSSNAKAITRELHRALTGNRIAESLDDFAPRQEEYLALKRVLAKMQASTSDKSWQSIPDGPVLHPETHSERVPLLRQRLQQRPNQASDPTFYDPALVGAVKQFQRKAHLTPDGLIGPDTRHRLNISPQDRLDIIRVNLERWRWLPNDLGERHVRVSITDYRLEAYDSGTMVGSHAVVVGKDYRQTPIFSDQITHLVINPWWIVPHSLAVKDLLPQFQQDPAIIDKKHYEIRDPAGEVVDPDDLDWHDYNETDFPFEVRQRPGRDNALGRVKFIFPNKHDVYLHDTPSQYQFDKTQRDFSSGCIRVEHPFSLAKWLLRDDKDWTGQRLADTVESGRNVTITPEVPVPVHLMYWTALIRDGGLQFPADIYQRDNKVLAALNAHRPEEH